MISVPGKLIIGIALLVAAAETADAATWVVREDGSGDFELVSQALLCAQSGDSVLIEPGTYVEDWFPSPLRVKDKQLHISGTGVVPGEVTLIGIFTVYLRCSGTTLGNVRLIQSNIVIGDSDFTIRDCTFEEHASLAVCGAVTVEADYYIGLLAIDRCVFVRNSYAHESCYVSAVDAINGWVMITDSVFLENVSPQGGGAVVALGVEPGITIEGCLFAGNEAPYGAAIWTLPGGHQPPLVIRDCTFWRNRVTGGGGALFLDSDGWTMQNCIVAETIDGWGLVARGLGAAYCTDFWNNDRGTYTGGGCGSCGPSYGNFSLDPMFCNPDSGDFRLQPGSPCLPGYHGPYFCGQIGAYDEGCSPVAVEEGDAPGGFSGARVDEDGMGLAVVPNPTFGQVVVELALAEPRVVAIEVYDVAGKRIFDVGSESLDAGLHRFWVNDVRAHGLSHGVYYAVGRSGSRHVSVPFVVLE